MRKRGKARLKQSGPKEESIVELWTTMAVKTREGPGGLRSAEQVGASELARRDQYGEAAASRLSPVDSSG
jgi:hypothetical protein